MKALSAQAPAKLVLFGEWAVLTGSPAICLALDGEFKAQLIEEESSQAFSVSSNDVDQSWDPMNPAEDYWELCQRIFSSWQEHENFQVTQEWKGKKLHLNRTWKIEEGLGSSSALFVCLEKLKAQFTDRILNWPRILASYQRVFSGSGIDLACQYHNSNVIFQKGQVTRLSLDWPEQLLILHSGNKIETQKEIALRNLQSKAIEKIGKSTEEFLRSADWEECIRQHNEALLEMGCIDDETQKFAQRLRDQNIQFEYKSTGAGGGDAILIWSPCEHHEEIIKAAQQMNWWTSPYKLIRSGQSSKGAKTA